MISDSTPRLHWTQRIALVRHNLHAARRTGDYTFFKTLQAHALIDGTDHVASLHSILSTDADSVLSVLDNLNAGIAYVHQDAFKAVYDGAKSTMYKDNSPSSRRSLLRVDICQQRDMADHAIDKTTNSAINFIETQPLHCQDAIANAWITGATIIADAVCVCLAEMEHVEDYMDDFIRLEYSWTAIQNSVDTAVSALRGIFNLMAGPLIRSPDGSRQLSISSAAGSDAGQSFRSRASSTASALGLIKRAFSHSHMLLVPNAIPKSTRMGPVPVPEANPRGFRLSMSAACPTRMSAFPEARHTHTHLSTIPPTPSANETPLANPMSPFKESSEYFTFDVEKAGEGAGKEEEEGGELMHIDSLDPLYSPTMVDAMKGSVPVTLRSLSETFGVSTPDPLAV